MKRGLFIILTALILAVPAIGFGDGKIYSTYSSHKERVPPSIPYQRAVIAFDGDEPGPFASLTEVWRFEADEK